MEELDTVGAVHDESDEESELDCADGDFVGGCGCCEPFYCDSLQRQHHFRADDECCIVCVGKGFQVFDGIYIAQQREAEIDDEIIKVVKVGEGDCMFDDGVDDEGRESDSWSMFSDEVALDVRVHLAVEEIAAVHIVIGEH